MRAKWNCANRMLFVKVLRRCFEYMIAIALALISGYWIVQGRW
jgi:hypothetical protein